MSIKEAPMSNRAAVDGYFSDWVRGDIDAVLERLSDDVVARMGPGFEFSGKDQVGTFLQKFRRGMSDIRYDIRHLIEQGDIVMLEGEEAYTKDGKDVRVPFMAIYVCENGKIREWRDYFDLDSVLKQLA